MAGDIVDARSPGICRGAVARPALPSFTLDNLRGKCVDRLAIFPSQRRLEVNHVNLAIGVVAGDEKGYFDSCGGVAFWDLPVKDDEPLRVAVGDGLSWQLKTIQVFFIGCWQTEGLPETGAGVAALCRVLRHGGESLYSWLPQMYDVIGSDQDGLMPALVLVEFELGRGLADLGENLCASDCWLIHDYSRFVDAEGVVPSVRRMRAMVLCMLLKLNDFNDFDDNFDLSWAVVNRFHVDDPPWVFV
jgi:hypothetical protein